MSENYKFEGWVAHDADSVKGQLKFGEFKPKDWDENDVDIQISHSGICGSDLHTLRSGWGATAYPAVVGHEIVGKAVRIGKNVNHGFKEGDVVGVGAQSDSCMACEECKSGHENYCSNGTGSIATYNSKALNGSKQQGGYANYARVPGRFCFKIPDGLPHAFAAPMMCGGVTTYTPLVENGCGPGKKVAIVGTGGLGHFGVLFAKELGASKVVAFSRKADKRADAKKMGADDYVATDEDEDWATKYAGTFDLIVSTISSPKMPLQQYLTMLRVRGQFIQVGAPEDSIPAFSAFNLIPKAAKIGGSMIGSRKQIEDMLALAAKGKVQPWVQERPMKDVNQALQDFEAGKARYRYVLTN